VGFEAVHGHDLLSASDKEAEGLLSGLEDGIGAMIQRRQGRCYTTASDIYKLG
jgi:hypothetical protein